MQNLEKLQEKLGYKFKNQTHLKIALTHKSAKNGHNNERLEFLGDAVMDLIVGEYLFKKFSSDEGDLSKLRAALVNESSFSKFAKFLGIGENLNMSLSEERNGGREKPSLLSDAFEAIMGAVYLESGLQNTARIAIAILEILYPRISFNELVRDYKTALQELTQAKFGVTPEYVLLGSSGPDHKKSFEMAALVGGKQLSSAVGASKKEVKRTFFALGATIGGGGIIFGLILGLFGVWLLGSFDIVNLPADVYGSSKLPMELSLGDLAMILIGAVLIVALSSWYPAKKATQIDVLQTLRNE